MRNLWPLLVSDLGSLPPLLASCVDPFTHTVYYVTIDKDLQSTNGLQVPLDSDLFRSPLLSLSYIQEKEMCCLVFASGEVVWAGDSGVSSNLIVDIEGNTLLAAQWSPSQELLAILSDAGRVMFLSVALDVISQGKVSISALQIANLAWKSDSKFVEVVLRVAEGWLAFTYSSQAQLFLSDAKSDPPGGLVECVGERTGIISSGAVSWQPEGLLTGIHCKTVVFWEKNGLKHGQFAVSDGEIEQLKWNSDGELLAVQTEKAIQLYYRSNYYWFLKQNIPFEGKIQAFHWVDPFNLLVLSNSILSYEFKWSYDTSNSGLALVVDGNKANITRLGQEVIPPPMFSFDLALPGVPTACDIAKNDSIYLLIEADLYAIQEEKLNFIGKIENLGRLTANLTVGNSGFAVSEGKRLHTYSESLVFLHTYELEQSIIAVLSAPGDGYYAEDKSGAIYLAVNGEIKLVMKLVRPCAAISVYFTPVSPLFIALHRSSKSLYINSNLLSTSCLGYHLSQSFLACTVQANAPLHVLHIYDLSKDLPVSLLGPNTPPNPPTDPFSLRNVERGAKVLLIVGEKLVMQLPRGNLETIFPRILLIKRGVELINGGKYGEAFGIMRKHKMDLNFLCDLDFAEFIAHIEDFVRQLATADRLNLFLTSLSPADSSSKYLSRPAQIIPNKVTTVCQSIRNAISTLNLANHLLLSVITSYIRSDPPLLVDTLRLIQDLKGKMPEKPHKPPHITLQSRDKTVYAEDALKYACWLIDANKLYDVALGTYDLELVLMVAQHTVKDPKEYLSYLQTLSEMEELDRKIQINKDLGRFTAALEVMQEGKALYFPQAIKLVSEKSLYSAALRIYQGTALEFTLSLMFGDYLVGQRQYFQAGVMYKRGADPRKALYTFQQAQEWDLMFASAAQLGLSTSDLAQEQVTLAIERSDYKAAAYLLKHYCEKNEETARELVRCLIYMHRYTEAVAVAAGLEELEQLTKNSVVMKAKELTKDLEGNIGTVQAKRSRLEAVKAKKAAMPRANLLPDDESASQYSVDSKASKATAVTKGKAKALQKLRKSAAKEGSQYEEEYLVDLILTLRPAPALTEQIEEVCKGLLLVGEIATAVELNTALAGLKAATEGELQTLRQGKFLQEFRKHFPDIHQRPEVDSRLCDIVTESYFLASGQASHVLSGAKVRHDLDSFLQSFHS